MFISAAVRCLTGHIEVSLYHTHTQINHWKIIIIISASTEEHDPTWFVGFSSILPCFYLGHNNVEHYFVHSQHSFCQALWTNSCVQICRLPRICTLGLTQRWQGDEFWQTHYIHSYASWKYYWVYRNLTKFYFYSFKSETWNLTCNNKHDTNWSITSQPGKTLFL